MPANRLDLVTPSFNWMIYLPVVFPSNFSILMRGATAARAGTARAANEAANLKRCIEKKGTRLGISCWNLARSSVNIYASATPQTRTVISISEDPLEGHSTMRIEGVRPHAELVGKVANISFETQRDPCLQTYPLRQLFNTERWLICIPRHARA